VQERLTRVIESLRDEPWPENLDVQPLRQHKPWLRIRDGDYRVIARPLSQEERAALDLDPGEAGYLVARVLDKKYADRIIRGLSAK
jgi:hypothetical protein